MFRRHTATKMDAVTAVAGQGSGWQWAAAVAVAVTDGGGGSSSFRKAGTESSWLGGLAGQGGRGEGGGGSVGVSCAEGNELPRIQG